jgi:adenosylmethionine-8-amino-7-oxononanoate aminotransferase
LVTIAPAGLTRVFFSDSGSTAVEVALKMSLGYWRRRHRDGNGDSNNGNKKGLARHRILALEHAYHGDTVGAMSVGAPTGRCSSTSSAFPFPVPSTVGANRRQWPRRFAHSKMHAVQVGVVFCALWFSKFCAKICTVIVSRRRIE